MIAKPSHSKNSSPDFQTRIASISRAVARAEKFRRATGNALDFLSGSQDLISIRGKGTSLRPFKVVHDMEVKAQQRYQERLTGLEAQLGKVEKQLTELQGKKSEGGRLVATPEITKAIEEFRRQQASLRGERRAIRQSLREGIAAMENRLLILNLLSTPILVVGFGLWFYHRRRK